tara:strand:- start:31 stop:711 length:681 start_codon:yes stop_codon:yes gene_type:complete
MPQVEAASCGVPVMSMDYSAMSSVLKNIGGTPVKVRKFREMATHTFRAHPDNEDFIHKLGHFFKLPKSMRLKQGYDTYKRCVERYTWDETAKKWEEAIDKVELVDINKTWLSDADIQTPPHEMPDPSTLSPNDFVSWCILYILNKPEMLHTLEHMKMLRNINDGFMTEVFSAHTQKRRNEAYSTNDLVQDMLGMRQIYNHWETKRVSNGPPPSFILNAKREAVNDQ